MNWKRNKKVFLFFQCFPFDSNWKQMDANNNITSTHIFSVSCSHKVELLCIFLKDFPSLLCLLLLLLLLLLSSTLSIKLFCVAHQILLLQIQDFCMFTMLIHKTGSSNTRTTNIQCIYTAPCWYWNQFILCKSIQKRHVNTSIHICSKKK